MDLNSYDWGCTARLILLLIGTLAGPGTAGPLAIDRIILCDAGPQLSIISIPGVTNQIQTLTDLVQTTRVTRKPIPTDRTPDSDSAYPT